MDSDPACATAVRDLLTLRATHPRAPALDAMDLVFAGQPSPVVAAAADLAKLSPANPFGQIVAAAFDRGMSPAEWVALTGPTAEPAIAQGLMAYWRDDVVARFLERYMRWPPTSENVGAAVARAPTWNRSPRRICRIY